MPQALPSHAYIMETNLVYCRREIKPNSFVSFHFSVVEFLNLKTVDQDVRDYMINIVKTTIEHREASNTQRKDFIQCLIQLRNTGKISTDDGLWDSESVSDELKSMTIEQCAAQVFLFYVAGFDTSASAIAYCLHELTQNPECAVKLRREIDETLARHNGELTYECIQEMNYLELCVMGRFSVGWVKEEENVNVLI